ncbi:uncharacterized protein LOC122664485 isoform X1 [Telopea speciosissima]|uniref:uncharacterized protein LOC122664485 isoform X1 n=1 Tax=Telopea speciosissima TaxID=54955 RepID=UPI001CC55B38|nr:uncharacterized protein LOC122664485 isoform X1 [Telopea speciosissima]
MAISQTSVSKSIASPNKEKKKKSKKNLDLNQSHSESDAGQNQQEAPPLPPQSPCSTPSKRTKCPGIRVIGGRIYDSENGKSCHQCRQKTMDFSSECKNLKNGKLCTIKFCHKCLLNRYGENAEETAVLDDWKCPKCRGICNCSLCMKKRGHLPTGILVHTAKKTGFSSVSEMLHVKGPENLELERTFKHVSASLNKKAFKDVAACPNKQAASSKESVATPTKKPSKEDSFDGKKYSNLQPMPPTLDGEGNKVEERKQKKIRRKDNAGDGSTSGTSPKKQKSFKDLGASPNQRTVSNKESVADPTRKCGKTNFSNGKKDSNLLPMPSTLDGEGKMAGESKRKKLRQKGNAAEGSTSGSTLLKKKSSKVSRISEENSKKPIKKEENRSGTNDRSPNKGNSELQIPDKTSRDQKKKTGKKDERNSWLPACNDIGVLYKNMDNATTKPMTAQNFNIDIQLPQGADLTTVAGIDLAAEDVGNALQFLEFCAAFGKVLDLKKGQPESILRELLCGRSGRRIHRIQYSPNVRFHAQLLSLIQKDLGEESDLLSTTTSKDSWLKALGKCISESRCAFKDLPADCFARDGDSYDKLDSSQKLKVLNFLCDETLGTSKLRNWIDKQNSIFVERAKDKVLSAKDKEKSLKWKLQNEVAKSILLINDTPLSISDHKDLVSKIKVEVAKAHAEKLEAMGMAPKKKQRSDAVRTEPVLLDGDGCVYWNLRGHSSEPNLLLQDIGNWDSVVPQEKWYSYGVEQTELVEKYISSLRIKRLRTIAVPDILPVGSHKGTLKHESPDDSSSPSSPKIVVADSEDDQES